MLMKRSEKIQLSENTQLVKLHRYPEAVKEFINLVRENPGITREAKLVTDSAFYQLIEGKISIQAKLVEFESEELLLFSEIIGNSKTVEKLNMLSTEIGKDAGVFAQNMAAAPALEKVYLGQTGIKDYVAALLDGFAAAPKLKLIDISGNEIARSVLQKILQHPLQSITRSPFLDEMVTLRDQKLWNSDVRDLVSYDISKEVVGIVGEYIFPIADGTQSEDLGLLGSLASVFSCCYSTESE